VGPIIELITLAASAILMLILSGFYSGSETGILSCSHLKVKNSSIQGDTKSGLLDKLLSDKPKILISLLIATNLSNTTFSLIGEKFVHIVGSFALNPDILKNFGFLLTSIILTPVMVIFGEIFPKSLFRHYSFSLTRLVSPLINISFKILYPLYIPFILLAQNSKGNSLSPLGYSSKTISLLMESGTKTGNLYPNQEFIIQKIMSLSSLDLSPFIIPFSPGQMLNLGMNRKQILNKIREQTSPFFVRGDKNVIGHLSPLDIWKMPYQLSLKNHIKPIHSFPLEFSALKALFALLNQSIPYATIEEDGIALGYISLDKLLGRENTRKKLKDSSF